MSRSHSSRIAKVDQTAAEFRDEVAGIVRNAYTPGVESNPLPDTVAPAPRFTEKDMNLIWIALMCRANDAMLPPANRTVFADLAGKILVLTGRL